MFIMFIKYSQVKIQKQGQNIKIQHGFICFVFLLLPIKRSHVRVQFVWEWLITAQTLDFNSSSQVVSGCTGASLFDFKGKSLLGRESPSLRKKKKRRRKRRMTHSSFQLLLSQSLLTHWTAVGRDVRLVYIILSYLGVSKFFKLLFQISKEMCKFVELTWVVKSYACVFRGAVFPHLSD